MDINKPEIEKIKTEVSTYAEAEKSSRPDIDFKYLMKERFEIDFSKPIPWLDNNSATAYLVLDKIDISRKLFALICSNETSPRLSILPYLKSIDNASLMKLVEFGTVNNLPQKSRNMALIYNFPLGGKVFEKGFSEYDLNNKPERFKSLVLNFLAIADIFKNYNITHRAIRPDNLYYRNADKTEIVIGDCAASFPAYHQPPAFETIESLFSDLSARGNGTDKNDIYSSGVTILSLLVGSEIKPDFPAAEILHHKIKTGSYLSLISGHKISGNLATVIKGLVHDNEELRWEYMQAHNFFDGKQVSYGQNINVETPKKAIIVNGSKVYMGTDVVYNLYNNIDEAYNLIINDKITDWVKNGLCNEKLGQQIENIVKTEKVNPSNKDILVAKVCILINHNMPIKFKGFSFFPDGMAKAIFLAMKDKKSTKDFVEIFNAELIKTWYQEQEKLRSPASAGELRAYISKREIGYGLERVIYDFDDDLPCISPLFGNEYVNGPQHVLRALNNEYKDNKGDVNPYDRTIIAYLRCKMGKKIEKYLIDLSSPRDDVRASAILNLYVSMQNKYGPPQLSNLARWLANYSKPIIQVYHNRKYQKYLERELLKVYKNGKLYEITNLLENEAALLKDRKEYANALNEVNHMMIEKNSILNIGTKFNEESRATALKVIALLSIVTMAVSFAINLVLWGVR